VTCAPRSSTIDCPLNLPAAAAVVTGRERTAENQTRAGEDVESRDPV
jgi:hypothetical protein